MRGFEFVYSLIALFSGGMELPLATGMTQAECHQRYKAYADAANNLEGTDIAIICEGKKVNYVSF